MDLLGQTIGHYQLVELIHQGENVVYKGFDPRLNRNVAVKVLPPTLAGNQAFVQQFRQDMQFISGLEHAHILPVYDFGQQADLLYIVSRFIDTGTLQDRLSQYYIPARAEQLIRPIAQALDYMHSRGAVHGNIKPANILLDAQGQPLLTDFGYTQGLDVGGRDRAYLSPEQARGERIDYRTDVYGLGALLYTLVIGQAPPVGGGPSPRSQRPDLPVGVEQVILKAMAQYPDQRFQTAGEFSNALNAALVPQAVPVAQPLPPAPAPPPQPAPAPPPAPAAQPESKGGTNWAVILIGVAVVCLLAVICSGLFAYFGLNTQDSSESPLLVPIFIEGPTDSPDPAAPDVPPAPEEPAAPEPPPEEPPPEEPPAPEPPPEEPPPEQPPEGGEGG